MVIGERYRIEPETAAQRYTIAIGDEISYSYLRRTYTNYY